MTQESLPFDNTPSWSRVQFFGAGYEHKRDQVRLSGQTKRVWDLMKDGEWRTLRSISEATGDPESSVSATLRCFRRVQFGAHTVNRQYVKDGLHIYQLVISK